MCVINIGSEKGNCNAVSRKVSTWVCSSRMYDQHGFHYVKYRTRKSIL
jgi:hypothetical protein